MMIGGVACLAGALALGVVEFPLEWHARRNPRIPCEIEIQPLKLGFGTNAALTVMADGKAVPTARLTGKAPDSVVLRFAAPAGAQALSCRVSDGGTSVPSASFADGNLFGGWREGKWKLPDAVTREPSARGLVFSAEALASRFVSYEVPVPVDCRGRPAVVEIGVANCGKMTWGGVIRIRQLDDRREELPDSLTDPRWMSHMRPPQRSVRYREEGAFHRRVSFLRVELELHGLENVSVDNDGLPLADLGDRRAALELSELAVRMAQTLPFPKYDDANFRPGVSGESGDAALRLDGEHALWYQTHSQAAWAEGFQFRREADCLFPVKAGTVEAWFKFDRLVSMPIFQHEQGYRARQGKRGRGCLNGLAYEAGTRSLVWRLVDAHGAAFEMTAPVEFRTNAWTHVAMQWAPGGLGEVFVNGRRIGSCDLTKYVAVDIADPKVEFPTDAAGTEFYLGSESAQRKAVSLGPIGASVIGSVDLFRASSGLRYRGDFTPTRRFELDADTRALFDFDRSFDGVSGDGLGSVLGCYRAPTDRVDHVLTMSDGTTRRYYPAAILPENDPRKVFDVHNYKIMPTPAEYRMSRRIARKSFDLKPGAAASYVTADDSYPDYVEIANAGETTLLYPAVIGKGELDVRSFGDLAKGLDFGAVSDREKVDRIFQMMLSASDYFMSHNVYFAYGTDNPEYVCYKAMTVLNGYCGFECGPLNNTAANMFAAAARCPCCQTAGYGHEFEQVFFDGKNHVYDLSAQKYFPAMDNETSAYLREMADQPYIPNRMDMSVDHFVRMGSRESWVWNPDYREKVGVRLRPGETFRVWSGNNGVQNNLQRKTLDGGWDKPGFPEIAPRYDRQCGAAPSRWPVRRMDRFFPDISNGFLTFYGQPGVRNEAFVRVSADSFCYDVKSGYPVVGARYAARRKDGTAVPLEISTNLKDFRPIPLGDDGAAELDYAVKGRLGYLIRVKAPMGEVCSFDAVTEVQVNRRLFPGFPKRGRNELVLKSASDGLARVTVQWRENDREIVVEGGAYSGVIPGFERQVVVLSDKRERNMKVSGVSSSATVSASSGFTASLKGGSLSVRATGEAATCGEVVISDGERRKELTLISCEGARLATLEGADLLGGARCVEPDADRVQPAAWLSRKDDGVRFRFDGIPADKYIVLQLTRWAGARTSMRELKQIVRLRCPEAGLAAIRDSIDGEWIPCAASRNGNCDYLKAPTGLPGGRGRWKWDYPFYTGGNVANSWAGFTMLEIPFDATESAEYRLQEDSADGVELAAMLLFPAQVATEDFRAQLKTVLCGYNCRPWAVVPPEKPQAGVGHIRPRDLKEAARRRPLIAAPVDGSLVTRETFASCGVRFGSRRSIEGLVLEFRKAGAKDWQRSNTLEYFPETCEYRGSVLKLTEDTAYELRLRAGEKTYVTRSFRTWSSAVPVVKTVEVDPAKFMAPLRIGAAGSGTARGWVRYALKPGMTLEVPRGKEAFVLDGASFVLLDGLRIRGCVDARSVVRIENSDHVRISNCDIAGWGRSNGEFDFGPRFGGQCREVLPDGKLGGLIDWDCAIRIGRGTSCCVVERCWIHDPIPCANSWLYAHPAGPQAVGVASPDHSTVIRYNDFVGSDDHRFNDVVESGGNFIEDGGFNRDADIYGNFMIFSSDDNIELDGGQMNVRAFWNRFEQAVYNVSLQGDMVGPSYTFENLFAGCGDQLGVIYGSVKTTGISPYGDESCAYVQDNVIWNPSRPVWMNHPCVRFRVTGNRFEGEDAFRGVSAPLNVSSNNVAHADVNRSGRMDLPYRPVPYFLDRGLVENVCVAKGSVTPATASVTVVTEGTGYRQPFLIAKNDAFDWFSVEPSSGVLTSGTAQKLTIRFDAARMNNRHDYRGAFLVRTADGFSRPVSVYAKTDFVCPLKPDPQGAVVAYVDLPGTNEGVSFEVPKDGIYYLMSRGSAKEVVGWTAEVRLDGRPWATATALAFPFSAWTALHAPDYGSNYRGATGLELKAGRHTLSFRTDPKSRSPYRPEGLLLTTNPKPWEPR